MFDSSKNISTRLADAADLLIDFATLGEYGLEPAAKATQSCETRQRRPLSPATTIKTTPLTGTWTVDPAHSNVEFSVKHLGIATVKGAFREFEGTLVVGEDLATSTVTGAQILSATSASVQVKVTIEAKYTSSEDPTPQPSTQVYDLTLVRRGTTWLVSDVASSLRMRRF